MTLSDQPLISIITVNYNGTVLTCELLKSIQTLTYPNLEIIVVDNASLADPTMALVEQYPKVKVIVSKINLGFAGGNNLGINNSQGDFLFFVNNDTELSPGIIEALVDTFEQKKDAGVISPKILYYFHPGIIEYAGYNKINFITAKNTMIGNQEEDFGQYDLLKETSCAHGGAMMVSRQIIDEVGIMPECYFLYYEEVDWCEQIKRKGFKIYYQPKAVVFHKESMSTGKFSPLKTYYLNRNRLLFMRRNASNFQLIIFSIFFAVFTIPKNLIFFVVRRQWNHLEAFYKGVLWNFTTKNEVKSKSQ